MATYKFSLITPDGQIFSDEIASLTVPGTEGQFGVLANHAPLVALTKEGTLSLRQNNSQMFYTIGPGVLEVNSSHDVLLLCDSAISQESK